jgi:hypothetical protein
MLLLLQHEPQIHYPPHDLRDVLDLRTFQLTEHELRDRLAAGGQVQADCSELTTELCRWAGLRDPNRLGYSRPGYTGTMLATLPHYRQAVNAMTGALVVFGPGTGEHVCMVLEPDHEHGDPLLFGHGSEAGPIAESLSVVRARHRAPVTFLSIADL